MFWLQVFWDLEMAKNNKGSIGNPEKKEENNTHLMETPETLWDLLRKKQKITYILMETPELKELANAFENPQEGSLQ